MAVASGRAGRVLARPLFRRLNRILAMKQLIPPILAQLRKLVSVRFAGVTGNPIRAYTDPGGSDPLAESFCRIGSASGSDPPPDQFY